MMKNKAHNLSSYSFHRGETLLFDANIWLYLYPPPSRPSDRHAAKYSQGLKSMRYAEVELVIDVLVLSEYLNTYCRIEWRALHRRRALPAGEKDKKTHRSFKEFRKSSDFAMVARIAADYAHRILKLSRRVDHPFAQTNIAHVLTDFEAGASDLNDGLLAETCRRNGWKLVTNDGDFTTGGIEVLTTNPTLLSACP